MAEVHILSGGIDSTAVLHRRLSETANEVHVLHVRRDALVSGAMETFAARRIVVWLASNVRHLKYVEATPMELAGKPCGNSVFAACGFIVGDYVVRNPAITTVVQGCTGAPEDQTAESRFRNRYREDICAAVCNGYAPAPVWEYPHVALSKAEVFQSMPEALRGLCWSCANPRPRGDTFVPCGSCSKCKEVERMEEAL
jgi:7-cyano-7-deazaguanine synthase in queuosine biosynthesis